MIYLFLIFITCDLLLPDRCIHDNEINRIRPSLSHSYISEFGNFMIHYDLESDNAPNLEDLDEDSIPDYVQNVAQFAELSRKTLLEDMHFLEEPSDADGIYDIYLLNQSAWGWNVVDSNYPGASYVKIDNDYNGLNFSSDYCHNSLEKMQISVAHEYFHAVQRAYKPNFNENSDFLMEMSSMWFEDVMVPNCNDYLSFVDALSYSLFNNPVQKFDGSDLVQGQSEANFGYSMALFGHYLTNIVDYSSSINETTIIRNIWNKFSSGLSPRESILRTVEEDFKKSFSSIWTDFISKNLFCGKFDYFNQNFYFHEDQRLINPISVSTSNFILPDEKIYFTQSADDLSVNIIGIGILSELIFNSISSSNNIKASFSRIGYSNYLSDNLNQNQLLLDNGDKIFFIFSSEEDVVDVALQVQTLVKPSITARVVSLYPNPIKLNNNLFIEITNEFSNNVDLLCYDLKGSLIFTEKIKLSSYQSTELIQFDLSKYINSSGSYKLVIKDNHSIIYSTNITFLK